MALIKAKERIKVLASSQPQGSSVSEANNPVVKSEVPVAFRPAWALGKVKAKAKSTQAQAARPLAAQQVRKPYPTHQHRVSAQAKMKRHAQDPRFTQEREKMESVENLAGVADDIEAEATLYEWRAQEQAVTTQSVRWYITLAVGVTVAAGLMVFLGNVFGAVAILFVGGLIYVIAQRQPDRVRYRIMVDGVAINDRLYQYKDLDVFNLVYKPGEVKALIIRSKKMLSPLLVMEIGDADPVEIRDILLEFLREDLELQEPVTDVWARRFGF